MEINITHRVPNTAAPRFPPTLSGIRYPFTFFFNFICLAVLGCYIKRIRFKVSAREITSLNGFFNIKLSSSCRSQIKYHKVILVVVVATAVVVVLMLNNSTDPGHFQTA